MRILNISTLHGHGGAAKIADTIHKGFLHRGLDSVYLAGYGVENKDRKIYAVNRKYSAVVGGNLITHTLLGIDLFESRNKVIEKWLGWADVVIVHNIHSHWISYKHFFRYLNEFSHLKVIFVAHDSWHYTGRCAFINNCSNWQKECVNCKFKGNYPKAIFSNEHLEYKKKVDLISASDVIFVSPARWIAADLRIVYPNKTIKVIRNAIDFEEYQAPVSRSSIVNLLVSSVDISQKGKHDQKLIKDLLDSGIHISFVGKNNPFKGHPNANDYGYISDPNVYTKLLNEHDFYLFTSSVDIYPTVIVEALLNGLSVLATRSKGILEFTEEFEEDIHLIDSLEQTLSFLRKSREHFLDKEQIRNKAKQVFNVNKMIEEYLEILR